MKITLPYSLPYSQRSVISVISVISVRTHMCNVKNNLILVDITRPEYRKIVQ